MLFGAAETDKRIGDAASFQLIGHKRHGDAKIAGAAAEFTETRARIIGQKRLWLSRQQAEKFYEVHKARPFYNDLVEFMTSGPVVVQALEGENAVARHREIMGATDPAKASAGTIRRDFAESIEANSVHGSDSGENAANEIAFFFAGTELVG